MEIILGRAIETPDGNLTHSKNPRKLHLECTAGTQRFVVELMATNKMAVPKEGENKGNRFTAGSNSGIVQ